MAFKLCDEEKKKFGLSDFGNCRSEAYEEIAKIQRDVRYYLHVIQGIS